MLRAKRGEEVSELEPSPLMWEFSYLVDYLFEVGPWEKGEELTHQEIRAWQRNTGVQLDDFGATALKQLSRAYVNQYHAARKADCPCPVQIEEADDEQAEAERQDKLDAQLRAAFMAMAEAGNKKPMAAKGNKKR